MHEGVEFEGLAAAKGSRLDWPEEEFRELFQGLYARLCGTMRRVLGDAAAAEEIAGEAFWRLYCRPQLRTEGNNVAGWLYRTATRMALDRLRARSRGWKLEHNLKQQMQHGGQEGTNPLQALMAREETVQVRIALRSLKAVQAQILILRYSGLSYLEIARAMGMNPTSVGTTLARAEAAFARVYGGNA